MALESQSQPFANNNETIDKVFLEQYYAECQDVVLHPFYVGDSANRQTILLIYCDGMSNTGQINQFVLPRLERMYGKTGFSSASDIEDCQYIPLTRLKADQLLKELDIKVFAGMLVVYFQEIHAFFTMDVSDQPNRSPEESSTESSIKGPHDGFTESLTTNVALVRKRLRSQSFCVENFVLSERGQTKVSLLYIKDIINQDIVTEIRSRLNSYEGDAIIGTSQIEDLVQGDLKSIFPLTDYVGRPDYVADSILSGRFAVIFDGSPMAIIAPITLSSLIKSPEDTNMPFHIVSIQRIMRLAGLVIALFLPGFYIALTSFNIEQVPTPLLATIMNSRSGLPFSISMETFMMLFLFEVFHEAGIRLPKSVGQTITVVGGLIVGDAAIRAGITSPTMIVMVAVTIIATFTLVNQVLAGTTAIIRLYVLMLSSFLGMFGFFIALFSLVLHLATLECYGVPYLAPISPYINRDAWEGLLRKPIKDMFRRPKVLRTQDPTRKGSE
ncbi:spore germination protein [Paenibacillus sp. J23TS9]|uniref:spore germination protein n=1 Tax=Paenibacillus sp. J23TS9 TaxID=2807193 RepID=UPI001B032036|nr:spore germination protein [Paenibacillus sp. J23TS9]GIP27046.1 spore germination protein [Paenibacillus sp. J23TS9]